MLALGGVAFRVSATATPEVAAPGERAEAMALRLSQAKARAAAEATAPEPALVIGADTIVVLDDPPHETILGKPQDAADAVAMLRALRGRTHRVLTAVTVHDSATGTETSDLITARVPMRAYTDAEIAAYVASGDPLDKAGAYAIQYPDFQPVDLPRFTDCFAAVMGLPVCRVLARLPAFGLPANGTAPADCTAAVEGRAAQTTCPLIDRLTAARRR